MSSECHTVAMSNKPAQRDFNPLGDTSLFYLIFVFIKASLHEVRRQLVEFLSNGKDKHNVYGLIYISLFYTSANSKIFKSTNKYSVSQMLTEVVIPPQRISH